MRDFSEFDDSLGKIYVTPVADGIIFKVLNFTRGSATVNILVSYKQDHNLLDFFSQREDSMMHGL